MTIWVLDNNIWISGLLSPESSLAQLIRYALAHKQIAFSNETYRELAAVVKRKRFDARLSGYMREKFFIEIEQSGRFFDTADIAPVCSDPDDDKFLALAAACEAEYLITGDKALLALAKFGKTEIITPSALFSRIVL